MSSKLATMPVSRTLGFVLSSSPWALVMLSSMGGAVACSNAPPAGAAEVAALELEGGGEGAELALVNGENVVASSGDEPDDGSVPLDEDIAAGGASGSTLAGGCTGQGLVCVTEKLIGTAVNVQALDQVPTYAEVLAREFDYVTPENAMKWGPLQATPGAWDFTEADHLVAKAAASGQAVKGHALVWHRQMPAWARTLERDALVDAVRAHVTTTVRHFRGRVRAWDVVNEAIADGGDHPIRGGIHSALRIAGMANAFKWARAQDPEAKLFYNDYGIEGLNSKSDAVYRLIQDLLAAGAPIDGIGFQAHLSTKSYPSLAALRANLKRFAALGLRVSFSELDVRTVEVPGTPLQRRTAQAIAYQEVASACALTPACEALTVWGFTDAYSWIDEYYAPDDPLPFDEQYAKKPAYGGLRAGLLGTRLQTSTNLKPAGSCESTSGWNVFVGGSLSLAADGRHGQACRVSGRSQPYHGPSLALTREAQAGQTLRVTAYARLSMPGSVRMTLKKVEDGKADEYLTLATGAANTTGWTLLSGNVTMGWETPPRELVLYFESPAIGGSYATLFVDDVTVQVLSRP